MVTPSSRQVYSASELDRSPLTQFISEQGASVGIRATSAHPLRSSGARAFLQRFFPIDDASRARTHQSGSQVMLSRAPKESPATRIDSMSLPRIQSRRVNMTEPYGAHAPAWLDRMVIGITSRLPDIGWGCASQLGCAASLPCGLPPTMAWTLYVGDCECDCIRVATVARRGHFSSRKCTKLPNGPNCSQKLTKLEPLDGRLCSSILGLTSAYSRFLSHLMLAQMPKFLPSNQNPKMQAGYDLMSQRILAFLFEFCHWPWAPRQEWSS